MPSFFNKVLNSAAKNYCLEKLPLCAAARVAQVFRRPGMKPYFRDKCSGVVVKRLIID